MSAADTGSTAARHLLAAASATREQLMRQRALIEQTLRECAAAPAEFAAALGVFNDAINRVEDTIAAALIALSGQEFADSDPIGAPIRKRFARGIR